jgi:protein-S-isoprenylcysteine O-methyltransferase Ste14
LIGLGLPYLVTGDLLWFAGGLADSAFVILAMLMWIIATAFVDLDKPRDRPDLANLLLPTGLILCVPTSVLDRTLGLGSFLPTSISLFGLCLALLGAYIGILARKHLGTSYSPRGTSLDSRHLVQTGPYRFVRHPLYAAAILWMAGWPLIIRSFAGASVGLLFLIPSLRQRIREEEAHLLGRFGEEFERYRERTWMLIPFIL